MKNKKDIKKLQKDPTSKKSMADYNTTLKMKSKLRLTQYISLHQGKNILKKLMQSVLNHKYNRQENQRKDGDK